MGKIKVHELAKELGVESKTLISKANEIGLELTSHLSSLEEEQVNKIKGIFGNKENKGVKTQKNMEQEKSKEKKEKNTKKDATPVIIRREVILADEEKPEKKVEKSERKDVGFVERKNNQDFNIVYRKQPVKPMTVSELFGLKPNKKEEKVQEEVVEEKKKEESKAEVKVEKVKEETKKETIEKANTTTSNIENKSRENRSNYEGRNTPYQNNQNRFDNRQNQNRFDNRQNNGNFEGRPNRYGNRPNNGNYENRPRDNKFEGRQGDHKFNNNRQNGDNKFNNQNKNGQRPFNKNNGRPLDNYGIDKNIKDIMATEIVEKEDKRDISTRAIDKEKANRYEDNKAKKGSKVKKNDRFSDEFNEGKLKDLKQVDKLSHMFNEQDGGMLDYYDLTTDRGKKNKRKLQKEEERTKQKIFELTEITIPEMITVKDLAAEMKKTSGEVIKKLFNYGIMATINNTIDFDTAFLVAGEFGITANKKEEIKEEDILFDETEDSADELEPRPPVVVVMGHVDHGKTSLLDAIRSTNVIEGEAGGITQHIGAYKVNINNREITFLDTPGHEAFTAMRARGAQITDVAILIVAADDGVMPQTVEAINHAKAAEVPIIVAINKIDLPGANVEKIKQELMEYELVPEEWGGDTIYVPISAKKKINIDNLLEMVLLVADMKELKANPRKQAKGTVIEARLDKTKGPIASMLVQRGTLDEGDTIVVGKSIGRIRVMKNDKGQRVKKAGPSTPVEIMGLTEVPEAGDTFYEVKDEKMAKHLIERRKRQEREQIMNENSKVTLSNIFEKMESENLKQLNIIVKADVQGTAQALKQSLEKLSNEEVKVKVIHAVTGAVTESDVQLAKAGKCIIIAFNVRPVNTAKDMAEKEGVEIKQYSVIYQAIEDVEAAMKGMLDPIYEEKVIGNAVVRQTFKVSGVGTIAGAYVLDGKIERNAGVRVIRENVVIHDGKLLSLKRFKDDVKEVTKGFECGLQIDGYNDVKEEDNLEFYIMEEVKR
ncbi:MAG: translation initiation factor IF-2 [Clostridia bacterium]